MKDIIINVRTLGTEEANRQIEELKKGLDSTGKSADGAAKSIKSLEKELDDMKKTLKGLDSTSDEFKNLARQISLADSELKDLNKSFEGLDSEAKAGELGKLAGGLGAIGTAASLAFGDNEDVEAFFQTFAQGLAITQAVKGGIEAYTASVKLLRGTTVLQTVAQTDASAAQTAYTAVLGTSTGALKLFKLALIATGIGAIVVLVGSLIANFSELTDWVKNLIKRFKFLQDAIAPLLWAFDKIKEGLQAIGVIDSEETKAALKRTDDRIEAIEKERVKIKEKADYELARANGNAKIIFDINKKRLDDDIKLLKEQLKLLKEKAGQTGEFGDEEKKVFKEVSDELKKELNERAKLVDDYNRTVESLEDAKNKKYAADSKKRVDDAKKENEKISAAKQKAIAEEQKRLDESYEIESQLRLSAQELEIQQLNQQFDKKFEIIGENAALERELLEEQQRQVAEIEQRYADEKIAREREQAQKLFELRQELKELNAGELSDNASPEEIEAYYAARNELELEQFEYQQEQLAYQLETKAITEEEFNAQKDVNEARHKANRERLIKEEADYELAMKQKVAAATEAVASSVFSSVGAMVGENAAAGKALAVAQTTWDTYKGATAGYAAALQTGPAGISLAPVVAGLAVAGGIANIKKILSTPIPGGGGGGASVGGGGGTGYAPAPQIDPQTLFSTQDLGPVNSQNIGSGAGVRQRDEQTNVRAYVVESEITSVQNRLNRYRRRSEIG